MPTELTYIFLWITTLGEWEVTTSAATIATLLLLRWKRKAYILPLWVALVGSQCSTFLLKIFFHRARPEYAMYTENSFSFPSGHAAVALAFYGYLAYVLFRNLHTRPSKMIAICAGTALTLALGFSRIYLGVHFVGDVVGGYTLGALWLLVAISMVEWLRNPQQ